MISILIVLLVVGVILYVINHAVPLDPPWPMLINAVAAIFVLIWLLQSLGGITGIHLR